MKKRFSKWKAPIIKHGKPTKYGWMVLYPEGLSLGENTDIGAYTLIIAKYGVEIEEGVQVGSHCALYSFSTIDEKQGKIVLKKGARVGTHCTIMPGVTVGTGAIVAAHSFVNKDVPARTIVAGVPARFLKKV